MVETADAAPCDSLSASTLGQTPARNDAEDGGVVD